MANRSTRGPVDDEDQPTSPEVEPTLVPPELPPEADNTRAETPRARTGPLSSSALRRMAEVTRTGPGSGVGTSGPSATAARALRSAEIMRARGFARMISLLSLGALIPIALVYREQTATPHWLQLATGFSLFSTGLIALWVWKGTHAPGQTQGMMRIFGAASVLTALMVQLYAGIFSPASLVIALGISYFGLVDDRALARWTCLGGTTVYAILAILTLTGVMPDLGLFAETSAPLAVKVAVLATVLAVFLFLYWQTRESREATRFAVERLDEALRLVQEREALLDEANQNLDLALAAGGRRGAFSGRNMGPYRLGELLGRGGMGEVYAAAHQHTAAQVAIKLLPGATASQPEVVQRFLREAELAKRLKSLNLVDILELGQSDDGVPFLAMEHLHGHDLGWFLRRASRLPLPEVLTLAEQVASGLEIAHRAGVVHRDLKPANLFRVDPPGSAVVLWKILDFGVAKLKGSHGTLTQHALVGTPGYMSPEQAQSREVDTRSDVFSFGAVLYRAITGRPPFSGTDTPQVLFDVVYRAPARPSQLLAGLSPDVDLVLAIALAKDPAARFATAGELALALESAARGALSTPLRSRAESIVRALPWGRTARPRDE